MLNETETAMPGSALTPSQVRKLKIAIAVMSVMLVAGFILLLAGLYMQTQKLAKKTDAGLPLMMPAGAAAAISLHVKAGSEISQILVDQGRLILHLRHAGGNEIAILDLATGRETQRIRLIPQETP